MTIPPRFLDELRSRLNLSDVIGKRIKVTRAGREFKACCPFHHEKTPSFTINDDKQFYHCFGCGAHGDVIGFVMQHDNLSFPDAVEQLSALAGLQMPRPDPAAAAKAEKAKDLHSLMEEATAFFQDILHNPVQGKDVLAYLLGRGLREETIQAFRIGYAPDDFQALRTHLKTKGYSDAQMIEAGVVKPSSKGKEPYVFFRERVIFPVSERRGRIVAFGGRILPDHMRAPDQGDYKPAKYINSSETPIFDKGRMLYGESLARQAARDGQPIIVTEGYMDVIACHQGGFKGAVAPMGTALTEDQILSLWNMIPEDEKVPILCFDGDNAGRSAASRACERLLPLLKPGQSARIAFLPEGEDPDSLLRGQGGAAFQKIIDSAVSLFDFIWASQMSGRTFKTPESRAGVTKALENQVAAIANHDVQRHYKALLRAKISETFFQRKGFDRHNKSYQPNTTKIARKPLSQLSQVARQLTAAIVNHPGIYESVEEQYGGFEIIDTKLNRLKQAIISALEQDSTLDSEALQTYLRQNGFEQEIGDILGESVYVHAAFASHNAAHVLPNAEVDLQKVVTKWLEQFNSVQGQSLQKDIKQGWKEAFHHSNEDEEEKLRNLVQARTSDR